LKLVSKYQHLPLFKNLTFDIERGQRWLTRKSGKRTPGERKKKKKKRKYSYRKTTELEEEIFARETRILSFNEELLIP